jgi:hypothetical protein
MLHNSPESTTSTSIILNDLFNDKHKPIDTINDLSASKEFLIHQQHLHRIDELQKQTNIDNQWRSCCITTDRRALIFFSQLCISSSVIILCMYMLINYHDSCETTNIYIALLTFILGIHLPQPKINK